MWKADFLKPYVSVVLYFAVNILLVKLIGLPGVIISSVLALVVVEIPWETIIFFKNYFKIGIFEYSVMIFKIHYNLRMLLCSVFFCV